MSSDMMMENSPVPNTMMNSVAITTRGKDWMISQMRIITMSTLPP